MQRRHLALLAPLLWSASRQAAAAAELSFDLRSDRDGFVVEAHALCEAPGDVVWSTLVDYEALPRFVPGMRESRLLHRESSSAWIRQKGFASFGLFSERFGVTLAVDEQAPHRIDAEAVAGDFVRFRSRYTLHVLTPRRTALRYAAALQPRRSPPPVIGVAVMRRIAREQFEAVVGEIHRRA
jgi:ribosome-associated toxin RatA of RatAB toxin-antitoxin module